MLLYYTGKPFCFCSRHLTEGIDQKTIVLYTSLLGSTDRVLFCRPVFTNDRRDSASIYFRLNNSTLRNWCLCGLSHESWMNRTHQQQFEAIRFPRCCATDSLCEAAALATKKCESSRARVQTPDFLGGENSLGSIRKTQVLHNTCRQITSRELLFAPFTIRNLFFGLGYVGLVILYAVLADWVKGLGCRVAGADHWNASSGTVTNDTHLNDSSKNRHL